MWFRFRPQSTCHFRNFIYIAPTSAENMTSCRFSRWRISAILDFRGSIVGSLKSPCTTSCRSSIENIGLKCLVFEKIAFLHFGDRQTDKRTDEQMDSSDALSRSRYRERRLNNDRKFQFSSGYVNKLFQTNQSRNVYKCFTSNCLVP